MDNILSSLYLRGCDYRHAQLRLLEPCITATMRRKDRSDELDLVLRVGFSLRGGNQTDSDLNYFKIRHVNTGDSS